MNTENAAASAEDGRDFLVIYAGEPPDEEALRRLIEDTGCVIGKLVLATPQQIASGEIDPADFDQVISVLDDDLACDAGIDAAALAIVQKGTPMIGVWAQQSSSGAIHPAVAKIGIAQVPWDAEKLGAAIGASCPQPFETSQGTQSDPHRIKHNKCG